MSTTPTLRPSPHDVRPLIGKLESTSNSAEQFAIPIPAYILCTVGRSSWCSTTLVHKYIANHQFSIQTFDEQDGSRAVYIVEEKDWEATFVNQAALRPHSPRKLNHGDIIVFGIGAAHGFLECKFSQYAPGSLPSLYDMTEKMGQGGFGVVRKCRKRATGQYFAVKIIPLGNVSLLQGNTYVQRECELAMKLEHAHIVTMHQIFREPWGFTLLMERAEYGDLEKLIREKKITEPVAKSVALDITHGLQYVHKLGIAHRDLKPSNILIFSLTPLVTKICDFGLAKPVSNMMTTVGTPHYMAPEVGSGRATYGLAVDCWGLGLAGVKPFEAKVGGIRYNLQLEPLRGKASKAAIQVILSLLELDPERRPSVFKIEEMRWLRGIRRLIEL